MACFQVNDVRCIAVPVMELEFIDSKDSGILFRLDQSLAIDRIKLFKPLFVDCLDDILAKAGNLSH